MNNNNTSNLSNIKRNKLLFIAGIIDALLGLFYFVCGVLEFTDMLTTKANTIAQTLGVQLSYLVFVSSALMLATGILSIIYRKTMHTLNLRVFLGVLSLAWPLFLSITLFFTQFAINIRLLSMSFAALFYMIAALIVKITNDEFVKTYKFNPSAMIASSGKRARSVDFGAMMNVGAGKMHQKNFVQTVESIAVNMKPNKRSGGGLKRLFAGKRKLGNGNIFRGLYGGQKRRSSNIIGSLFQNKRRRSRPRFRR